jgi:predicted Rossmann fold nucleotide-binding protein DprA/Smf involved in DNA uptake
MAAFFTTTDDNEAKLLSALTYEPIHIYDLGRCRGLPMPTVSGTLAMMELRGLVNQVGEMSYIGTREVSATYEGSGYDSLQTVGGC